MGFSITKKGNEHAQSAEPNVVPLCDVLLVLLIIFMVVTPLVQRGVDVRLPYAQFTANMPENPDVVLAIKRDTREPGFILFINQDKVALEALQSQLEEVFLTVAEKKLYLKVDQDLEYGIFAEFIWDMVRAAGIDVVGIITEKKTERID